MFTSKKKSNDDGENSISVYVYIVSFRGQSYLEGDIFFVYLILAMMLRQNTIIFGIKWKVIEWKLQFMQFQVREIVQKILKKGSKLNLYTFLFDEFWHKLKLHRKLFLNNMIFILFCSVFCVAWTVGFFDLELDEYFMRLRKMCIKCEKKLYPQS